MLKYAAGYHPGPVAPPSADGASLFQAGFALLGAVAVTNIIRALILFYNCYIPYSQAQSGFIY